MNMVVDVTVPEILTNEPKPTSLLKSFHRRKIQVWEGQVPVDRVRGWVKNKRTQFLVQQWREDHGRDPDDDQLYQLVLNDDTHAIKSLADNIYQNGVRTPIILTADGRLLDGNRRYFGVKFLLTDLKPSERSEFRNIPAWVLSPHASLDDETNIVTERNLVDDQKKKWPYYVVARQFYEENVDEGVSIKDIAAKYDLPTSRVKQQIEAIRLADEFLAFHDEEDGAVSFEVKRLVYDNLIWFDQIARSHAKLLAGDVDFKEAVFRMIVEDPPKFNQARDFVHLNEIRANQRAWEALTSTKGPAGLEQALQIVAAEKLDAKRDPLARLERIVQTLKEISGATELRAADPQLLDQFHKYAAQVPGSAGLAWQFERMTQWLNEMRVEEVAALSTEALEGLMASQERVRTMAEACSR